MSELTHLIILFDAVEDVGRLLILSVWSGSFNLTYICSTYYCTLSFWIKLEQILDMEELKRIPRRVGCFLSATQWVEWASKWHICSCGTLWRGGSLAPLSLMRACPLWQCETTVDLWLLVPCSLVLSMSTLHSVYRWFIRLIVQYNVDDFNSVMNFLLMALCFYIKIPVSISYRSVSTDK